MGQGKPIDDPFRRGLGHAVQWYTCLQGRIEKRVGDVLQHARQHIPFSLTTDDGAPTPEEGQRHLATSSKSSSAPPGAVAAPPTSTTQTEQLVRDRCSQILQERCPACFAEVLFGVWTESPPVSTTNYLHRNVSDLLLQKGG